MMIEITAEKAGRLIKNFENIDDIYFPIESRVVIISYELKEIVNHLYLDNI